MQQGPIHSLPGAPVSEAICRQETNAAKLRLALGDCFNRCITHYDEDSLPHHPGEKVCMDRCFQKLGGALDMSKEQKKLFDARAQDFSEDALPKWIAVLDKEHKEKPRKN